jgi:hypothetical protein
VSRSTTAAPCVTSPNPTTRRQGISTNDLAVKLAVLRALKSRIRDIELQVSEHFLSTMDVGDAKAAALPDGTRLGKVTKAAGKSTPQVVDESAFLNWVEQNHPSEIQSSVRPAFRDKILGTVKAHGRAVDWTTGEVVPGIELRQGDPYISFRSESGYVDAIAGQWYDLVGPALLDGE